MDTYFLPIVIIILGAVTAVLIHRMVGASINSRRGLSCRKYSLSLLLLSAGIILIVVESKNVTHAMATKRWPTVQGRITSINVLQSGGIRPRIKYAYKVGHQDLKDETDYHFPYLGMSSTRKEVAHKITSGFETHKPVVVYYNPEDPAESYLKPGPTWDAFTRLSFGSILYGAGVFLLYSGWLNRAKAGSSKRF